MGGYAGNGPLTEADGVLGLNIELDFYPSPTFDLSSSVLPNDPLSPNAPLRTTTQNISWGETISF